ncbi:hypothetical protein ACPWT1_14465 [Ramlibacter sp. MMS24-I3-19]|uniref:hypothetical protein n=1 Tax=Ramlibacter sp. MMS24-I3-19 TaxID=3416606 RepID=UPI003D07F985
MGQRTFQQVQQALHQPRIQLQLEAARLVPAADRGALVQRQPRAAARQRGRIDIRHQQRLGAQRQGGLVLVRRVEVGALQELLLAELGQHAAQFLVRPVERAARGLDLEQLFGLQPADQRPQAQHQASREPQAHLLPAGAAHAQQQAVLFGLVTHRELVDLHARHSRQPPAAIPGGFDP